MKSSKHVVLSAAILLVVTTVAFAQGRGRGGQGRGGGNYDPATEVTVNGTIDEVKNIPGPANGPGGLHLMLRSEAGVQDVHLGPSAFVSSKKFEFAKGDAITVTGSKVKLAGQDAILAREIKKGSQVLTLRDAKGFPLWAGRGRGSS